METWAKKLEAIQRALEATDGCGAQTLMLAKDYLVDVSVHLNSLRPIHDCASCRFWRILDCEKAPGKLPPEHIQKSGCEMWEDGFELPF